jgi:hypothetical protein
MTRRQKQEHGKKTETQPERRPARRQKEGQQEGIGKQQKTGDTLHNG